MLEQLIGGCILAIPIVWKLITFVLKERQRIESDRERLEAIYKELRFNGGASLKDSIKRIEETQAKQLVKLDMISDLQESITFETDSNGRYTYVSKKYCELTGRTHYECLTNGWHLTLLESERDSVISAWLDAVDAGRIFEFEFKIKQKFGKVIKVSCTATPVYNGSVLLGWCGCLHLLGDVL